VSPMKFSFYMPVRVIVGADCVRENRGAIKPLGRRAFVMSGARSAQSNGSLADMTEALDAEGITWRHYPGVRPNPSLGDARAAAAEAREFGADFVVALGGGSPMDAAKAVAVLAAGPEGMLDDQALLSKRSFDRVLPVVAVPTTAGTGSEVTPYSILTNPALETKSFLNSEQVYPRIAFLDGRYSAGLPLDITAATALDAMSHSVEGYLAVRANPVSRALALESLGALGPRLRRLSRGEAPDAEGREALLYASLLAGIVISQSGTTAVHAMGYSLTYFKGIDHGLANGLLMASYLEWMAKDRSSEVARIASSLGCADLRALRSLLGDLAGIASSGRAEAIADNELERFAGIAIKAGNILNTEPRPSREDLLRMLRESCGKDRSER